MDLIPDIPIPTQNKLIPDPILTPAKSGINTALVYTLVRPNKWPPAASAASQFMTGVVMEFA